MFRWLKRLLHFGREYAWVALSGGDVVYTQILRLPDGTKVAKVYDHWKVVGHPFSYVERIISEKPDA